MPIRIEIFEGSDRIRDRVAESVGGSFEGQLTLSAPYRVDTIELEALANGHLKCDRGDRWQCLVSGGPEPAAAVDVVGDDDWGYSVVSINRGTLAAHLNDGVTQAEGRLEDSDYSLSQVEVPALHIAAARFLDTESAEELFMPVLPMAPAVELERMGIYRAEAFVEALQAEAQRVLRRRRGE